MTTKDFETTSAVSMGFLNDVCMIHEELGGLVSSFTAIEASHNEEILTDNLYHDAIFGMRVAFGDITNRLGALLDNTHGFVCVMVKEAK